MSARARSKGTWELQVRPHATPIFAYGAAIVIVAIHVTVGALLKIRSTGVYFQTADQVALIGLGVVLAAAVLLLTRPRLRAGASGLAIRNLLGERLIEWPDIVGVSFPAGARWARVDLPDDEYIPLMAIQAVDKDRAVVAMDSLRKLVERYRPGSGGESGGVAHDDALAPGVGPAEQPAGRHPDDC
ncbi:MAG: hypothetical protein QOH60_3497 [Mycobacterium sp.]|jgi:hypothetical protein|nr:hypothetical protein [Mycobacterium sp.]